MRTWLHDIACAVLLLACITAPAIVIPMLFWAVTR